MDFFITIPTGMTVEQLAKELNRIYWMNCIGTVKPPLKKHDSKWWIGPSADLLMTTSGEWFLRCKHVEKGKEMMKAFDSANIGCTK